MSDQDIRKLYESIQRGESYTPSKRLNNMYHDVYNESYTVNITDEKGNTIYTSTVDNEEEIVRIKKDLDRVQKISVGKEQLTVYQLIDRVLEIDGWKTNNKNYVDQILEPIKRAFHQTDIQRDNFGKLIELQTDQDNPIRTVLLANPGVVYNFNKDLLSPKVFDLFMTPQEAIQVVNMIWDIDTKISGISVGRGEIVMTLFSDALKGKKGDLELPGIGEVELKGTGARLGGDGFSHTRSLDNLENILQSRKIKINDHQLNLIKQDIISKIERLAGPRAKPERKEWINKYRDIIHSISVDPDIPSIIKDVNQAIKQGIIPKNDSKPIVNGLDKYNKRMQGQIGGVFSGAIDTFFRSEWNLTSAETVQGVWECRSYNSPSVERAEKSIQQSIYNIINSDNIFDDSSNVSNLSKLIAALHLTCYQLVENFQYIVFGNDTTKSLLAVDFTQQEAPGDMLERLYNIFKSNSVKINTAVDKMFKSIGVELDT